MKSNKKLSPIVTEFFLRGRKLNISLVFISQYFFKVPKIMILNGTCYKRKLQQKKTSTNSISLALSSRNVSKYEFLTGKYFLPEKNFQQKKRFEYSPLGKELKVQTDIAKKQYQGLDKIY